MNAFFAGIIATLKASVAQAALSIGASLSIGMVSLVGGFTSDEKAILVKCQTKFHDTYEAAIAATPTDIIGAIEKAATAAYNEFTADETAEMAKECGALITLWTSSLKSALGQ
jgi:hypothetical protein